MYRPPSAEPQYTGIVMPIPPDLLPRLHNRGHNVEFIRKNIIEVTTCKPTVLEYSSCSNLEEFTSVNTWTVKGLKTPLGRIGTCQFMSAPFTHQNSTKWCMVLDKEYNDIYLSFLLKEFQHEEPGESVIAKLKADEILPSGEKREVFPYKWYRLEEGAETKRQFVRRADTVGRNNNENEITLRCEVYMQGIIHDQMLVAAVPELHSTIMRGLNQYEDVHTDFELHAGGTVLKAHKGILAVHSPYFAAMLQPHTKEAKDGFALVSDVKPKVLKQVLLFIYTGVAPDLKDMPWDLLIAADKYQLQQLKRQCEAYIASCLDVHNAANTAANASIYSCDLLWDHAVAFIHGNLSQVTQTPGWLAALAAHPEAMQRVTGPWYESARGNL